MMHRRLALLGGWLFIVAVAQYFIAQWVAAFAWNPPYDWFGNYISDLGNTACAMFAAAHRTPAWVCSPRHALMNAAFVASGALLVAGTAALWRFWQESVVIRSALVLLLIAGCGKMLVGLAPENQHIVVHSIGALNIPLASLSILLISVTTWRKQKLLAGIGLAAFSIGILGTILSIAAQVAGSSFLLGLGVGGMERLAGYPANVWLASVGITAVVAGSRSRRDCARRPIAGDIARDEQAGLLPGAEKKRLPWRRAPRLMRAMRRCR